MPLIGFYSATKWAVEALHESLAEEVKPFGIAVTLIEPGAYATDFGKSARVADVLEPYADFRKQFIAHLGTIERGDPQATVDAILKLVDTDNPPLRLALGSWILPRAVPLMPTAWPPGRLGRLSRRRRKASPRKNAASSQAAPFR
jgi:NAD(P)-dependent dehydrogenase (short-subunit alcohol dehydrogenase family)